MFFNYKIWINEQNQPNDRLTLCLRLAFAFERRGEKDMESYFHFELTPDPTPTSLFIEGRITNFTKDTFVEAF